MTTTKPTGEQLRFRSSKTGDHDLDIYLEASELGSRTLADLLSDLFQPDGVLRPDLIQLRITTTGQLQYRIGDYANPSLGWADVTDGFIFRVRGAYAQGTAYERLDIVTQNNSSFICTLEHTASTLTPGPNFTILFSADAALTNAVRHDQPQSLSPTNQATARTNIGAPAAASPTTTGTFGHTGAANINGNITVTGNANLQTSVSAGTLFVAGTLEANGDLQVLDTITHIGDTDTRIRFPAADTISFETAAIERARITASGSVGIGTAGPAVPLHVSGGASGAFFDAALLANPNAVDGSGARLFLGAGAGTSRSTFIGGVRVNSSNAHDLILGTSSNAAAPVERARITASGNLGVGTNTPAERLHVFGGNSIVERTGGEWVSHIIRSGAGALKGLFLQTGNLSRWALVSSQDPESGSNTGSDFGLNRYTDAGAFIDQVVRITRATGNVGIGTTSPATRLHVGGSARLETDDPTLDLFNAAGNGWRLFSGTVTGPATGQFLATRFNAAAATTNFFVVDPFGRLGLNAVPSNGRMFEARDIVQTTGAAELFLLRKDQTALLNTQFAIDQVSTNVISLSVRDQASTPGSLVLNPVGGGVGIGRNPGAGRLLDVEDRVVGSGYQEFMSFLKWNSAGGATATRIMWTQMAANQVGIEVANHANTKGILSLQPYGGTVHVPTFSRLGVGTTTPATALHVLGGDSTFERTGADWSILNIRAASGALKGFYLQTGTLTRWNFVAEQTPETGANVGSNFQINRFNDAGNFVATALSINRASGAVSIPGALTVSGNVNLQTSVSAGSLFVAGALEAAGGILLGAGGIAVAAGPVAATGVGNFGAVNVDGTSYTLPAGGTWAYALNTFNSSNQPLNTFASVAAGGTNVVNNASIARIRGFVWRIA